MLFFFLPSLGSSSRFVCDFLFVFIIAIQNHYYHPANHAMRFVFPSCIITHHCDKFHSVLLLLCTFLICTQFFLHVFYGSFPSLIFISDFSDALGWVYFRHFSIYVSFLFRWWLSLCGKFEKQYKCLEKNEENIVVFMKFIKCKIEFSLWPDTRIYQVYIVMTVATTAKLLGCCRVTDL